MKKTKLLMTLWLACSFAGFPAHADTKDPVQLLVNAKPATKALHYSPVFQGRGDGVHTCPVTGERVTKKSLKADYYGRTVYFCCQGCLKSARLMPEKYIKPTMKEQIKAAEAYIARVPKAPSGEEFCNE